jgi:guanylate kinase
MTSGPIRRRGFLLVLSSPSGAGKTTITRRLVTGDPSLSLSVSVTTRPPRRGETEGIDYYFINRARFEEMSARGELLEHATVFGNCYGTPRAPVEEVLSSGKDVVGDVDWQGTQQLAKSVPSDLVSVFILPPSTAALAERLSARAQDSAVVVAARMAKSTEEMSHWPEYDYVIINRDVDESVAQARAIVTAERLRRTRLFGLSDFVCGLGSDRPTKLG